MLLKREMCFRVRAWVLAAGMALAVCAAIAGQAAASQVRHYEQVSPPDKGDGDIIAEGEAIVASKLGDGATFESRMQFDDAVGSGVVGRTTYLARRSSDGRWLTHSVTPMSRPESLQIFFGSTKVPVFSEDLSSALVWGYDLPGSTDDTPDRENLYLEDTATGALKPISVSYVDDFPLFAFFTTAIWGVSADAKHVGLNMNAQLLPDAAPSGVDSVYKWDDGTLTVAGILPNGLVPSGGASVIPQNVRGTMSADGTRLVFSSPTDFSAPPQLYMHIDGRRSVWISQPEGSDRSDPVNVAFQGMTPDGKNVFFLSDSPLLNDDPPGPDLYRWTDSADPAGDANLTRITDSGRALNDPGGNGETLVGMSDDGTRVYFYQSNGALKVWDNGTLKTIDPAVPPTFIQEEHLTLASSAPGFGRVSPDGNWLAYITNSKLFVYDLRGNTLTCVSCPSNVSLVPDLTESGRLDYVGIRPRWLSDDGTVFFTSTGALVPQDTNGVADVYAYDGPSGTLELVTSGKGSDPMEFANASASGDDVFVVTRQRLAPSDRDDYIDLYDVRVGPAPVTAADTAPACENDACQGALSEAPAEDQLGSLSLQGGRRSGARRTSLTVRHRVAFRGATGILHVRLGAAGRLRWSGRGLISGSVKRSSAGRVTVRLRLGHRARMQLMRTGRYATTVRLRLVGVDGTSARRAVRVTFKVLTGKGR